MDTTTADEQPVTAEVGPRQLRDFLPGGPAEHSAVMLHFGAGNRERTEVVILGSAQPDYVKFTPSLDGAPRISIISASTTATPITDPQRQNTLLSQALHVLASENGTLEARNLDLCNRRQRSLDEIRQYAIERHRDGEICRDGLNKFLSHFDMDEYQPRIKVTFTITGSYEVDADTTRNAEYDGRNHLRLDFDNIDHYVDDSDSYNVTVDDTEEINED